MKRWVGSTGVFVLAFSIVGGRAAAQPAAAPAAPAAQAPAASPVPAAPPAAQPPAAQPPAAQPPAAQPPAAQPPGTPQPATPPAASPQGGYPPPAAGRWVPAPDGSYTWMPAGYELPPVMPYREGQPVPPGYHLEERVARGPLVTGYFLTGIPYAIGVIAAVTSNFTNSSGYLLLPWVGPWLTLGLRKNKCETTTDSSDEYNDCFEDTGVSTALVFDGILQGVGGALILGAHLAPRQKLVRDDQVSFRFTRVGTGYGVGASGLF